jgi:hypothetical protein
MSRYDQPAPEGKDPALWEIARKRASFKTHAITYVIINAFLWGIWYVSGTRHGIQVEDWEGHRFPWPIWTTLGWGIGLAFHFAGAYIFPRSNSVEKEYEKLKNQQKPQS